MPRLIGLTLLLWAVFASFDYSFANAPGPETSTTVIVNPVASPIEALTDIGVATAAGGELPGGAAEPVAAVAWKPGVYSVLDDADDGSRLVSRDRDVTPRDEVIGDGATFGASRIPGDAQQLQGELEPGLYATTFDAEGCTYELWQVLRDRSPRVIAEEHLAAGRLLVSVNAIEPDWFSSTAGCGDWHRWEPLDQPLTRAGNGDYWVGDLAAGRWEVPAPCRWEKVVAFRGVELADVEEAGVPGEALVVDDATYGIRVRGCHQPLTLAGPVADLGPEGPDLVRD